MPGLARKLLIIAAVDGLILQPYGNGTRNYGGAGSPSLQIDYKTPRMQPLLTGSTLHARNDERLEAHGVIGILSVASYSFLISITQREQVAQILGKPIFIITGVAVIPLSSQTDASKAIVHAQRSLKTESAFGADGTSDNETDQSEAPDQEDINPDSLPPPLDREKQIPSVQPNSHIAEDVIKKRGRYRRFASQWFFEKLWQGENKPSRDVEFRNLSDPSARGRNHNDPQMHDAMELEEFDSSGRKLVPSPRPDESEERAHELMPKFLRYTKMFFGSRSFYFSYDYDITRRFSFQDPQVSRLPLSTRADPLFFWNRHLLSPFIESGELDFALPVMQGFIGQQEFTAEPLLRPSDTHAGGEVCDSVGEDENPAPPSPGGNDRFLLTLISRRSIKRSGVRYLRRGVDDEGNTANMVETEQILSRPSWEPTSKVYSLLQLRGSIPLYFSQSPYTFKPIPVLRHSTSTNQLAFDKHFHDIGMRYGKVQAVCLLDKHGVEVNIGEAYEKYLDKFNSTGGLNGHDVGYEWFDFHSECRGMKFENVRRLVAKLADTLDAFGDTVVENHGVLRTQSGIVRTNCMDCLDRTGVTQCAFGQRALEQQLKQEGYFIDLQTSTTTQWFNILWADNGDAISRQYSSTAALKGDYTRTRKRNYRGALNDLGLTLSRYYNNIVNDYFSQACIDYLLGLVTTGVFDQFEMELESTDPGISMEKVQQNAIETSCKIVISDDKEELVGGWTMLSPHEPNTLRSLPFEQSVLLLTNAAVYCCRFDWNTEKVTSFERIDLDSITKIKYGTYITSTLTEAQMDEKRNVGIAITYMPGKKTMLRVNTRSLQSLSDQARAESERSASDWDLTSLLKGPSAPSCRHVAFKIPQTTPVALASPMKVVVSELDTAQTICNDIERTARKSPGLSHPEELSMVEEAKIISLTDAKKQTGYLEHLVFDIKKLVWA
ncbi:SacI domain-containing protein [Coccidioides immitis RS]|uniref:SacI domain-containing protein n=1 Tax=Coccidioides immitis (strain RS) TaxID=246410 RepID=J3KAJ5_COCIM|nr:SacI domain-containing protein [Coccidioides immitis RS]EAS32047.3 SacI domain-containing protein [Coccidioides immitis RS]